MVWILLGVYIIIWILMGMSFYKGIKNSTKYNQTEDIADARNATKNIKQFIILWIISMIITFGNIVYYILFK